MSFTVRLDPVSILPPGSTPTSVPAPEEVKQPNKEETPQSSKEQTTLGITTLNLQPLPSLTGESKPGTTVGTADTKASMPAFGVTMTLEAPTGVIPGSVSTTGVTSVSAPFDASAGVLPNLPGVGQISAPGQSATPPIGATPADGIPSITPPGSSDVATPNIPGIGTPGQDINSVMRPPASGATHSTVETQNLLDDDSREFFANIPKVGLLEANRIYQEKQAAKLGAQVQKAKEEFEKALHGARLDVHTTSVSPGLLHQSVSDIAEYAKDLPPGQRLELYQNLTAAANNRMTKQGFVELGKMARFYNEIKVLPWHEVMSVSDYGPGAQTIHRLFMQELKYSVFRAAALEASGVKVFSRGMLQGGVIDDGLLLGGLVFGALKAAGARVVGNNLQGRLAQAQVRTSRTYGCPPAHSFTPDTPVMTRLVDCQLRFVGSSRLSHEAQVRRAAR